MQRQSGRLASLLRLDLVHAQVRYAENLMRELRAGDRWLDLGCGHQIVPGWVLGLDQQRALARTPALAVGSDMDASIRHHLVLQQRVIATGYALPFGNASFSLVTANMVMEHVEEPVRLLREVARVLQPGGRFLFHTPNRRHPAVRLAALVPGAAKRALVWWLENRREEDVFPTFYRMNSVEDIRRQARDAGLEIAALRSWSSVGVLSSVPVARALELPILWMLERKRLEGWRSNFWVALVKPSPGPPSEAVLPCM
jgi:ubiquinone/menaquinone biosynthesis C-methylase UbiE